MHIDILNRTGTGIRKGTIPAMTDTAGVIMESIRAGTNAKRTGGKGSILILF
jgi:hypothetical protein